MKKKAPIKKGTAIWINETGAIKPRVFDVVKEDKIKKTVILSFNPKESYEVKKLFIRAKRIIIYEKGDGSIVCQNPDNIGKLPLDKLGIKTLRFNLQNSALQESKAALWRWTTPQNAVDKLIPLFRLMFITIAVGVLGWAAFKFGGMALDAIVRSRLMDCAELFPKVPTPIGVVQNLTSPLGA